MKLKSYFVPSVGAALMLARDELGPEAVLLEARKAPPEAQHLGHYEVVFGVGAASAAGGERERSAEAPMLEKLRSEVRQLRRELERMQRAVVQSSLLGGVSADPEPAAVLGRLLEAEVDADLAREVAEGVRLRCAANGAGVEAAVLEELEKRCRADASLGAGERGPRVVALVGPSGAGKTTALVKLAVREAIERRKPVLLVSLDNYRVAGAEQLRSFATILGAPFRYVETPAALGPVLEEARRKELVLMDTPGYGPGESEEAAELAAVLAGRQDIDCHLVLTASMRSADLRRVAERFEPFRPRKLLFTRLDETDSYGALWSLAVRLNLPVSFLSAGQRIPEDLEPASSRRLAEWLWSGRQARTAAAAA